MTQPNYLHCHSVKSRMKVSNKSHINSEINIFVPHTSGNEKNFEKINPCYSKENVLGR